MSDKRFYALDQNGARLYVGDTVLYRPKGSKRADVNYPPSDMFYVVTRIEPDYEIKQGHNYARREMPEGGQCSYVSVDGPEGAYPKWGGWYADDFIFSCRGE